jgi:ATP-dependent helicase/nuclease subunit A
VSTETPPDEQHRLRIRTDLDTTLFVEAGAGSGKTSALVGRILQLVTGPSPVPLRNIAAITFTEKAAAELRDRVRGAIETRLETGPPANEVELLSAALDDLDGAAISTLHAFAQRLLSEHPVEAGLPPAIEVLDEISSQVAFDQRWTEQLDRLLDDPELTDTVLCADAAGISAQHLRDLAVAFNENWDLLLTRLPPVPTVHLDGRGLVEQARAVLERRAECHAPDDTMLAPLAALEVFTDRLERAHDDADRLALLTQATRSPRGLPKVTNKGRKTNWDDVDSVRTDHHDLLEQLTHAREQVVDAVIKRLARHIAAFTLDAATDRRRQGRLEFHDLLVQARELLRSPVHWPEVRGALRDRYRRLLLDEFQDTDPIQIELAALLAMRPTDEPPLAWDELDVEPGRLFFVGDPKQSIYRFRRADIGLFLGARERFGTPPVRLTTNFRSTPPVIAWVNEVFGQLIVHEPGSQPEYEPLTAHRSTAPGGPGVLVLGAEAHPSTLTAEPLRAREATEVAAAVATALTEGWPIRDPHDHEWRPCRLGDITILLPARTSLPALERALDEAGIPHRAETSSLVWSTREIRDLMMCLRAVDDPTDELALVSALRSAVFGCGDDDLYRFRHVHGGRWSHQLPLPDSLPDGDPVGEALTHLHSLHQRRMWATPSELLEDLVRQRRVFEHGIARGRPRDVWRRVRFVLDQARAYGDSEGGSLRQFLQWAKLQSADGSRVSETVLPETDDDSVRIMTIHGSKGLEFPIAVVSGLSTQAPAGRRGVVAAFPPDGSTAAIKLGSALETREYERFVSVDEQMAHHERLRLLYVACTRASDHLVVSLHRKAPGKTVPAPERRPSADLLAAAASGSNHVVFEPPAEPISWRQSAGTGDTAGRLEPLATWQARRDRALTAGTRPRSLSATAIADRDRTARQRDPGLDKAGRDLDLPPWMKGRFGTAIGRAVHAILQTIDLSTGDRLEPMAAAQAAAEGVVGAEATIAALVRSALAHDVVIAAAASRHWRETYVAAPVGGVLVEGYIDLLHETPDGSLVVIDHKTDAVPDEASLAAKADRYRLQAATYALALEASTGLTVARTVLLFLDPDGATAHEIVNLQAAMTEVEGIIDEVAGAS